jgi:nitrate reductase / nitrite oxidoreductase, alpha subunit
MGQLPCRAHGHGRPGTRYRAEENAGFKYLVWDETSNAPRMPLGTLGFRWQQKKGEWNLQLQDGQDGSEIWPGPDAARRPDEVLQVAFDDFGDGQECAARVPVRYLETASGPGAGHHRVRPADGPVRRRPRPGRAPIRPTTMPNGPYTPAWQEKYTGIDRANVVQFAREWAATAEQTEGQMLDHHRRRRQPLVPRQPDLPGRHRLADAVRLRRQERRRAQPLRRPGEAGPGRRPGRRSWGPSTGASRRASRTRRPIHYVHSDQWRYERTADEVADQPGGRAQCHHRRAHHGSPDPRRAQRLAAVLPAVRPQPGRGGQTGRGGRRRQQPGDRRLDGAAVGRKRR